MAVHVDNGRDSGDKVGSLTFKTGKTLDDLTARTLIEVKGPDNTVRLRQAESQNIQQSNCEMETLRVFRPIISQVFGKLLEPESEVDSALPETWEGHSGTDLKEHVVGILFSRSKLSHLQKQVCSHIVAAISKEARCLRDDWELSLCSEHGSVDQEDVPKLSDSYCFEMVSLLPPSSTPRNALATTTSMSP